ncbi:hypothetical protein HBI65_221580 [Parastagonospora nodorum]|nr:hypothetical protein HBI65_221580 [Parastagonospora nodorum]
MKSLSFTYDHRALNTRLPVRSAIFKQRTGGLVVRWVTTGESPLLYVFVFFFASNQWTRYGNKGVYIDSPLTARDMGVLAYSSSNVFRDSDILRLLRMLNLKKC